MLFHTSDHYLQLLTEEPVLTATLLTIGSRYCPAPPGTSTNPNAIHERLWTHLRDMIERFCWGNESVSAPCAGVSGWFGNSEHDPGWMCFGETALPAMPSWGNANNSSLGLIESLLLLIDWPSRAGTALPQVGTRCIEEWRDSVAIGNSLSRVLVTTARGLARELGVFEGSDEGLSERAKQVRRVLPIYESQLMPGNDDTALNISGIHADILGTTQTVCPVAQADFIAAALLNQSEGISERNEVLDTTFLREWMDSATHTATGTLFRSTRFTTELIKTGKYVNAVREFDNFFLHWRHALDQLASPSPMRSLLLVDYHYLRIYVNSISLQAARDRSKGQASTKPSPPGAVVNHDERCMHQTISGCQDMLQILADISSSENVLRHLPARSFFLVGKGVMFLLETFVLRTRREEVRASVGLLESVTKTLRVGFVDEVHLMAQLANLLDLLAAILRKRFWNAAEQGPEITSTTQFEAVEEIQVPVEEDNMSMGEDGSMQEGSTHTQSTGCTTPENREDGTAKMIDLTVIDACETVDMDMVTIGYGSGDGVQEEVALFHDFILPAR